MKDRRKLKAKGSQPSKAQVIKAALPKEIRQFDDLDRYVSLVVTSLREKAGISQNEASRVSGLHRTYIGDFERGARRVSIKNLSKLAQVYGIPLSKLIQKAEKRLLSAT